MNCFSSYDQAQVAISIDHDFGRNYGSDEFEPAKLRGRPQLDHDEAIRQVPLVWGQEAAKFLDSLHSEDRESDVVFGVNKDGSRLAVSTSERAVIYDVRSKERLFCLQHEDKIERLEFSSNDNFLLASTSREDERYVETIKIWDLEEEAKRSGVQNFKTKANMKEMTEAMLMAAQTYLINSTQDWSLEQFKSQAEEEIRSHLNQVLERIERRHESSTGGYKLPDTQLPDFGSKAWHPSESTFLFLRNLKQQLHGVNGTVADLILFDAVSKKEVVALEGHDGPIMWSGFSPDGDWIASSSWDSKVRIWGNSNGELRHVLTEEGLGQSWTGRFSPDSNSIAVGNGDGRLRIWDVKSGDLKFKLEFKKEDKDAKRSRGWVRGIEWVSETLIFASQSDGIASLFDLTETHPTFPLSAPKLQNFIQGQGEFGTWEIEAVKASKDGNRLGFKIGADEIFVYDRKTNERWSVVQTLNPEEGKAGFSEMEFANDGGTEVWAGGSDGILRFWKLE